MAQVETAGRTELVMSMSAVPFEMMIDMAMQEEGHLVPLIALAIAGLAVPVAHLTR